MNPQELLKERTEMIDNVYHFKPNKRTMLGSNVWSWQVLDCGYKQSEVMNSYELSEKVNREFHDRYQFDIYTNLLTRNPGRLTRLFGGGTHFVDESDEMIQTNDRVLLEPEEYDEYMENKAKLYWTKILPRFVKLNDPNRVLTMAQLKEGAKDMAVAKQKRIYIFAESTLLRFAEFFEEVPKGTLLVHLEQDDPLEFRKRLPNIAVAGGMPTSLLGGGTKEDCINHARKMIDGMGEGFVLC